MLSFQRTGDGPPVVLIHGFLGSWEVWDKVAPELDPEYDAIMVNLPGHGGSQIAPVTVTMRDIARQVTELLDHLGFDDAIFVGHSWGGYVTCELLASFPERVKAAAVVYSSPYSDTAPKRQARDELIARFENEPYDDVIADALPVYVTDYDPPEVLDRMIVAAKQAGPEAARMALVSIRDRLDHVQEILASPQIPVLFVSGTDDASMPEITVQAPHVTTVTTKSGHMGPQTVPADLADILLEWMATVRKQQDTADEPAPEPQQDKPYAGKESSKDGSDA